MQIWIQIDLPNFWALPWEILQQDHVPYWYLGLTWWFFAVLSPKVWESYWVFLLFCFKTGQAKDLQTFDMLIGLQFFKVYSIYSHFFCNDFMVKVKSLDFQWWSQLNHITLCDINHVQPQLSFFFQHVPRVLGIWAFPGIAATVFSFPCSVLVTWASKRPAKSFWRPSHWDLDGILRMFRDSAIRCGKLLWKPSSMKEHPWRPSSGTKTRVVFFSSTSNNWIYCPIREKQQH